MSIATALTGIIRWLSESGTRGKMRRLGVPEPDIALNWVHEAQGDRGTYQAEDVGSLVAYGQQGEEVARVYSSDTGRSLVRETADDYILKWRIGYHATVETAKAEVEAEYRTFRRHQALTNAEAEHDSQRRQRRDQDLARRPGRF